MITFLIYLLMFGNLDNIIYSFELMQVDCANDITLMQYQFDSVQHCSHFKDTARIQFMTYIASNLLTSSDIGAYLYIVRKGINPLILRNQKLCIILGEKAEILRINNTPLIVHKDHAYHTRDMFIDYEHNNQIQIFVKGYAEPIGKKFKSSIESIMKYDRYLLKSSRAKPVHSFKILNLGHFRRNWIAEVNIQEKEIKIRNVKRLDPSLPVYKFGIWKRLQVIILDANKVQEVTTSASSSLIALTSQIVNRQVLEITEKESSIFLFHVLKTHVDLIEESKKLLVTMQPIVLYIMLGIIAIIALVLLMGMT